MPNPLALNFDPPLSEEQSEALRFPRIDPISRPPDLKPKATSFDAPRFMVTLTAQGSTRESHSVGPSTISFSDIDALHWDYSLYGSGQPFELVLGLRTLQGLLGEDTDIHEWYSKNPNMAAKIVCITATSEKPYQPILMYEGQVDTININYGEDQVRFTGRDRSYVLWEIPLWGTVWDVDTATVGELAADITEPRLRRKAITRGGELIDTIVRTSSGANPKLGIFDASTGRKFITLDGVRVWDLLQSAAQYNDMVAFVFNGTLWVVPEEFHAYACGGFYLVKGENLIDLDIDHTAYQSKDTVLVMAITNPLVGPAQTDTDPLTETGYVVVRGIFDTQFMTRPPDNLLQDSPFGRDKGSRVYRVSRYNVDWQEAAIEAQRLYRELTTREFIITATIAGHAYADPFSTYIVQGTGTVLDGMGFTPKGISHSMARSGGWTTEIVAVSETDMQRDVRLGRGPVQ